MTLSGSSVCERPPVGWTCSWPAGHEGPCAARKVAETATVRWFHRWVVEGHSLNHDRALVVQGFARRRDAQQLADLLSDARERAGDDYPLYVVIARWRLRAS